MTLPAQLPPPPPPSTAQEQVHVPEPDVRDGATRYPVPFWDRVKVLNVLLVIFLLCAAYKQSVIPIMTFWEAVKDQAQAKWWLVALMGLEVLHQLHIFISERSRGYHRFWQQKVFGGWNRRMGRLNPWLRYRMNRFVKLVIFLVLFGFIFSWRWGVSFWAVFAEAPARIWNLLFGPFGSSMPLVFQLLLAGLYGVFSLFIFYAIFFVGGVDTYKPGEIKTRFTDVWGQDPVLMRVKESVDFLEKPQEIEAKGGHVPGGILLWGPPGTGKTLMAEAIAGETGKPYVFVDPSAFIQTFIGVAPMKIKYMYRKLRKLALRYGGVVVFFDEADALGNRGALNQGGWNSFAPASQGPAGGGFHAMHACNGVHYASDLSLDVLWQTERRAMRTDGADEPGQQKRGVIMMGGGGGAGGMGALQALLTEMSGLKKPRGFFSRRIRSFLSIKPKEPPKYRILHVMATNMPNALDEALLRPGRIDRIYKVGYPHADGRRRTFEGYLAKVKHNLTPQQIDRLALISPYATGAVIKDMVNEALIVAMRDGRDVITYADMLGAKHLKTHGEADDWTYGDLERHAVAIHEACHAVAMYCLQKRSTIDVATIERRGGTGGFVAPIPLEERFASWRSEMEIDAITFLASLAGEKLFFDGDNSAGVGGDLHNATRIITEMAAYWGMGDHVASRSVTLAARQGATARPEDGTDRMLFETDFGKSVEGHLRDLVNRASELLNDNRRFVLAIAHALETYKTITGDDIDAIFRGHPGPTVDGWQYHTDEFLLSYEAYHLSAVAAHHRQGKPEHKLPVLTGAFSQRQPGPAHRSPSPWGPPSGNGNGHGAASSIAPPAGLPAPSAVEVTGAPLSDPDAKRPGSRA